MLRADDCFSLSTTMKPILHKGIISFFALLFSGPKYISGIETRGYHRSLELYILILCVLALETFRNVRAGARSI